MDLNTALMTFNTIKRPVDTTPIGMPDSLESKFNRLKEWKSRLTETTTETETTQDEAPANPTGFRGFTYTPTSSTMDNGKLETTSSLPPLLGSDNLTKTINFFKDKGFNPIQISGIVGNLLGESSLNTKAINQAEKSANLAGYGRGIAQWSNERVDDFKRTMGVSPENASLEQQLAFTWHEMSNRPALLKALLKASTIELATDAIYRGFENGSAHALTTPEQMSAVYSKAWAKLGYKKYDFQSELNSRVNKSKRVLNYLNS